MKFASTNTTRREVEAAIERLAVLNPSRNHGLRDNALGIIDDVTGYLSERHGEIPEACVRHLENAVHAVSAGHYPRVIHETHNALDVSDRLGRRPTASKTNKPMRDHTDKLLAKLKRAKAPTS